jgi:replication factor C subunit 3/5
MTDTIDILPELTLLPTTLPTTLPWIEKYRPKILGDIISHEHIISTLKIFINNRCLPHLLFYGPPGCGKTSTIMALSKELFGQYHTTMVMELNASDDRGIEVVRDKIKKFVMGQNVFFGNCIEDRDNIFKLVILDEIDAMTTDAQAILRKIIEQYTDNARFCLICNCVQNIIPALQSRCRLFRFSPLDQQHIQNYVNTVIKQENLNVEPDAIQTIIRRASGDMRKVLNILQSTSMICDNITTTQINNCLGYPHIIDIEQIFDSLIYKNFGDAYSNIISIKLNGGLSLGDIITEIHDILINYILNKTTNIKYITQMSDKQIMFILDKLRQIEANHYSNTNENIQCSGLIGIFKIALNT